MIVLDSDGSFRLDRRFFTFCDVQRHYSDYLVEYLGLRPRKPADPIAKPYMDLAASVQKALESALINMLKALLRSNPSRNICLAGGVALNCTANAEIIRQLGVNVHIHPAAGDSGGALGCALAAAVPGFGQALYRVPITPYLGLCHQEKAIQAALTLNGIGYTESRDIRKEIARKLASNKIVAVLQGKDEWGPRALGNRSILADPRDPKMKDHLNAKIKFREEFRPFAPVVMKEYYGDYFETLGMKESPHMLFTHKALKSQTVPAVVHEDKTSRVQTVSRQQNPYLYGILEEFFRLTGVPVLINTSFNLRGEPIVGSPSDALKTFYASGIDYLAIEDFFIGKEQEMKMSEKDDLQHASF